MSKDASKPHGHTTRCKECTNRSCSAWYKRNRTSKIADASEWYRANKEQKKAYDAVYHPLWRERNKERERETSAAWRRANREWARNKAHRRREAIRSGLYVTADDLKRILAQPCLYCGAPAEHIDHVIPLARGGRHSIGNLAPACAPCNLSKGAKLLTEWNKYKRLASIVRRC